MENLQQAWDAICEIIKQKISVVAFTSWVEAIKPMFIQEDCLFLSVRTAFQKNIIETNYSKLIEDACEEVFGFRVKAVIQSEQSEAAAAESGIEETFTFSNFIVCTTNQFAYAAAKAVSAEPGKTYNPLFIYGNSGLGKTHLLTAIKKELSANFPEMNIVAIQGEDFINDFIESLGEGTQREFRKKYRFCDALLLDDIQFIAGKSAVQEEFFHTFEALVRSGKQIVLTSDRAPREILSLDSRLRGRFETGLADIKTPDLEARVAIVRKKAEQNSLALEEPVIEYIAENIKTNIRQIQAVITKLSAKYIMNGTVPNMALARETCSEIISDVTVLPEITVDFIKSEVCSIYQLPPEDIDSKKQSAQVALVRQVAMYICRKLTPLTLEEIGKAFGNRHCTTVHYSIEQTEKELRKNPRLRETVEDIEKNIKSRS